MNFIFEVLAVLLWSYSVLGLRNIVSIKTYAKSKHYSIILLNEQKGIVTMYKKEGCPYCSASIDLLQNKYSLDIKFVDIESDKREEILNQMRTFSGGRNTVPQIFFNAEHLGGNDDVQKLDADGKLKEKVEYVMNNSVTMMQEHWFHPWY